ncbi:MAG: transcription termination/antitermination protein NusA [Clostridiales bacterium]|nr:transcription termination/antitermination protein NusA [Clostridiales bacterium]
MRELLKAMEELEKEEGISQEYMKNALITALEAAYKENYGTEENVKIDIDKNGDIIVFAEKTIVEKVEDEVKEISLEEAKKKRKTSKVGDVVKVIIVPKDFGRIAVQKGKQIIVQKLREKEKEVRFNEYQEKKGEIITGIVQKATEGKSVILDLGKLEGIMPVKEQVEKDKYAVNQKIRVYVQEIVKREKGDVQVIVSRRANDFLKRLFEYEIPEIDEGLIEVKSVSREPGVRSKVAVYSKNENIDPVGSCIGPKGLRIESIKKELRGEKIDVVEWSEDPAKLIAQALLPAEIMAIDINEETRFAQVIVADDQLTLAIGKKGQNVRLAVELTHWAIDIKGITEFKEMIEKGEKDTSIDMEKIEEEQEKLGEVEEVEETFEETETFEKEEEQEIEKTLEDIVTMEEEQNEEN